MPQMLLSFLLKGLLFLGVLGAIAYLAVCLFLVFRQNRLIFFPSAVITTTPADVGLTYQDVWLPISTSTGKVERMHAWWIPAAGEERGVVLHLHGNGINVGANVAQAYRFHELGFAVLLIDYRGYGRSEGSFPSETQVCEDAEVAWQYLTQEQHISPANIFLYGHSLGGAIAIDLAVRHPEVAGLIIQSSFTSMRKMVDLQRGFGLFPADLILKQKFDSIGKVRSLQTPVLYIHGTADRMIPAEMSQLLFEVTPGPKDLLFIPNAGHNDVGEIGGSVYTQALQKFFQQVRARQQLQHS